MDLGIAGRVALVTAASKGLGFASAKALAEDGAKLVVSSRDQSNLDAASAQLPDDTLTIAADMNDPQTPQRLVDAAVARFGALHIVVANNGGPPPGPAIDVTGDAVHAAVDANLLSTVRLVQSALPHLRDAGWGRVCCITSVSVKQPIPFLALSNVARTGLFAWVKTAANELGDGITLNLACPGSHATERMRALGSAGSGAKMGDPADFGKVVAFLCSEPAKFVNGTAVAVDGGAVQGLL